MESEHERCGVVMRVLDLGQHSDDHCDWYCVRDLSQHYEAQTQVVVVVVEKELVAPMMTGAEFSCTAG